MKSSKLLPVFFFIISLFVSFGTFAQLRLPRLISDGMVIQRNSELEVWGWAQAGEEVVINFNNKTYTTSTNHNGIWKAYIATPDAGGPYQMQISASETITLNDILSGDVWLCSGQSNMELPMRRVSWVYPDEIETAGNSNIRMFDVPKYYDFNTAQIDFPTGKWTEVTAQTIYNFPAAAYFFANDLYETHKVPIGLIISALGGSPAEAWLSEESLKQFPEHYSEALKFRDENHIKEIEEADNKRIADWHNRLQQADMGHKNTPWHSVMLDDSQWQTISNPTLWKNTPLEGINGAVWFRKEFEIEPSLINKPAMVILGALVDADSVFINGKFVGSTGYQYPPRRYQIPKNLLKAGKNQITVKIISNIGNGGFVPDKDYMLVVEDQTINLSGSWKYNIGAVMEPLQGQTFVRWKPMGLYNAMINPLLNYNISGVIWYQGESNAERPEEYRELFPAVIHNWRRQWNKCDFPFIFVQLANFMEPTSSPNQKSDWAMLREAQLKTLNMFNTAMAVTIDIGEWNDIHPLNKKDVGLRLSRAAQNIAYGNKNVVHSGPIYRKMEISENKIILHFDHTAEGLTTKKGEALKEFIIAGADKKFYNANAVIENNAIVVWSNEVPSPVAVRYAWADNPQHANLYNSVGLPASPFRTDDFEQ